MPGILDSKSSLTVGLTTDAKDGILKAARKMTSSTKLSTVTTKDIEGIKGLSFNHTITADDKGNVSESYTLCFELDLDDDLTLKISGMYCKGKISIPVMITHKKEKWSIGCEILLTFNPLELLKNGFYLVGSMPLHGTQVVIKYNFITGQFGVTFRMPLAAGNSEDKKGAAECKCDLTVFNINYITKKIQIEAVYEYETIRHQISILEYVSPVLEFVQSVQVSVPSVVERPPVREPTRVRNYVPPAPPSRNYETVANRNTESIVGTIFGSIGNFLENLLPARRGERRENYHYS